MGGEDHLKAMRGSSTTTWAAWMSPVVSTSSRTNPNFNICCSDGAVNLPPNRDPPPQMMMWNSNQDYAILFREHARRYNNALAFTSVNYLSDSRVRGYRPFQIYTQI